MNMTLPTKLLAFVLTPMLPAVAAAQTSAFAPYYNNRGLAREAKGDLDGAIADFNRAIELDPKLAISYHNRGLAQKAKGAIPDFNRAIELNPKFAAGAYSNRGLAKQAKGDLDGAIADFNRAIELNPKDAGAYYLRALAKEA